MQFNTLGSGTLVGLIAMAGVFLVLAIIGATLFLFRIVFYREKKHVPPAAVKKEAKESSVSKKKIAIISAALYYYLGHSRKR